jgi:hypothetical protein
VADVLPAVRTTAFGTKPTCCGVRFWSLLEVCADVAADVRSFGPSASVPTLLPVVRAVRSNFCLAFWLVQGEEDPFIRANLVSRHSFEHLANCFWSEALNNMEPPA